MLNYPSNIYRQAVVVLGASTRAQAYSQTVLDPAGNYASARIVSAETMVSETETVLPESRVFQMTLSSVPVIWESELSQDYRELGQALSELTELQQDDDWHIDPP